MQRQSRHNRLVLNTPDQASCDVFRPCPPGWEPAPLPPFPPQPDPDSDEPVVFGFVAVGLPDGAGIDQHEPEGGAPSEVVQVYSGASVSTSVWMTVPEGRMDEATSLR